MKSELVLVVCTANVCRSPLAALVMRHGLRDRPDVRVETAGTHALEGAAACDLVVRHRSASDWAEEAAAHRARTLVPEMLDEAGLILAATREIRGEIVRLNPAVRDRTYTLREAAHRGSGFAPAADAREAGGVISGYAAHLDRARASMGPVPAQGGPWHRGRCAEDEMSIVDGHGGGLRRHRRALELTADASEAILAQLNRFPVG